MEALRSLANSWTHMLLWGCGCQTALATRRSVWKKAQRYAFITQHGNGLSYAGVNLHMLPQYRWEKMKVFPLIKSSTEPFMCFNLPDSNTKRAAGKWVWAVWRVGVRVRDGATILRAEAASNRSSSHDRPAMRHSATLLPAPLKDFNLKLRRKRCLLEVNGIFTSSVDLMMTPVSSSSLDPVFDFFFQTHCCF